MSLLLIIGVVCVIVSFLPHLNKRRFRAIRVLGGLFFGAGVVSWLTAPLPPMGRTLVELLYATAALAFVLWFGRRELLWLKKEDPAAFDRKRRRDQGLLWVGGLVIVASLLGRFAFDVIWVRDFWIVGVLLWVVHFYRYQTYRALERDR